jgi:hypothetical protein
LRHVSATNYFAGATVDRNADETPAPAPSNNEAPQTFIPSRRIIRDRRTPRRRCVGNSSFDTMLLPFALARLLLCRSEPIFAAPAPTA